jgi:hypothetical protein
MENRMLIELPENPELEQRAGAAGYASVQDYVRMLVWKDLELAAIQEGIAAAQRGELRDFVEFDREFRLKNNIPLRD